MNEDQLLGHTITDVLYTVAERALYHYENDNLDESCAIINEWTTSSGESILTHVYTETLELVKDELMYFIHDDGDIGYGTFTFAKEPVDNETN